MKNITKQITIAINADKAFDKFLNDFSEWWPREYTWSQNTLKQIKIDGKKNGLCTEFGPYGFRCDWGRVTEFIKNEKIELKWQIGPHREPVPDPCKAGDLVINFIKNDDSTTLKFEHLNFENYGDAAEGYRAMMDSEKGWDYILNCYKKYCERK